jgi:hypothetical protein
MSMFIHSDDHASGTSSSGTWQFGQSLKGNYRIDLQVMDPQTIPWLWSGNNMLTLRIHDMDDYFNEDRMLTFNVTFNTAIGTETDPTTIGNMIEGDIQARVDALAVGPNAFAARNFSHTVNTTNKTFDFTTDLPIDLLWTGYPDPDGPDLECTCREAFGKGTTPDELKVDEFTINYANMTTDPRLLEVTIAESPTCYITGHNTFPTLLFTTKDAEFTGQTFEIRNETTSLSIDVRRLGQSTAVPLTGSWYLVITPF